MLLSRYIFKKVFLNIAYFLLISVSLLWLIQSIKYFYLIENRNIDFIQFFSLTGLLLPDLVILSLPFIFCIGATYSYFQLYKKKELVVMSFLGFSKKVMAKPLIMMGVLCCAIQVIMVFLAPSAFEKFLEIEQRIKKKTTLSLFKPNTFNVIDNHLIYFESTNVDNVFIAFFQPHKNIFIASKKAELIDNALHLEQGYHIEEDTKHNAFMTTSFKTFDYPLPKQQQVYSLYKKLLKSKLVDLLHRKDSQSQNEALSRILKILLPLLSLPLLIWGMLYRSCFLRTATYTFLCNIALIIGSKMF